MLLLVSVAAQAQERADPQPLQNCWTPSELAADSAEKATKRGREALREVPVRRAAGHTPSREKSGSIRRVNLASNDKRVALTFDLCERGDEISGYDGEIVDFLREKRISATFFMGGKWMLTHRERAQQLMSDPLFEIGNHTWEHVNLRLLQGRELHDEIERADLAYEEVRQELRARQCLRSGTLAHERTPDRIKLFRFPYGACDRKSLDAVARMGLKAIQWDVSSGDSSFSRTSDIIVRDVLSKARAGSIILFHANGRGLHTRSALPRVVSELERKGYRFVRVSELLEAGGSWERSHVCFDYKRGDTDQYDKHAERSRDLVQRFKELARSEQPEGPRQPNVAPDAKPIPPTLCSASSTESVDERLCDDQ